MRIEQSSVALASQHQATSTTLTHGTMEAWLGNRGSNGGARGIFAGGSGQAAISSMSAQALSAARSLEAKAARTAASQQAMAQVRSIAQAARAQAGTVGSVGSVGGSSTASTASVDDSDSITDPNLRALIQLVEHLTGKKIHLLRAGDVQSNAGTAANAATPAAQSAAPAQTPHQPAGWGVEVHAEQVHQETEATAYEATGTVQTADGRSIAFDFESSMHREESQTVRLDIVAGDAARKIDPIALNLDGGPVSLSTTRTAFDLNSDGTTERVALPSAGTYFLSLDRNGNGTIDSGSELFGPSTGNGFSELASLDQDGNGWIDEADAAFSKLGLWSGPAGATTSLADAGVGALYVGANVATSFEIKAGSGDSLGQLVSSSVYLKEDGTPGALARVDLTA